MLYNNINRTHHASDFYAQPGGTFSFMGCFMYQYPKQDIDALEIIAMFRSRVINDSMEFFALWRLFVILRIFFSKELKYIW